MELTDLQKSTLTVLEDAEAAHLAYHVVGHEPRTGAVIMEGRRTFRVDPDGEMRNA